MKNEDRFKKTFYPCSTERILAGSQSPIFLNLRSFRQRMWAAEWRLLFRPLPYLWAYSGQGMGHAALSPSPPRQSCVTCQGFFNSSCSLSGSTLARKFFHHPYLARSVVSLMASSVSQADAHGFVFFHFQWVSANFMQFARNTSISWTPVWLSEHWICTAAHPSGGEGRIGEGERREQRE